MIENKTTGILIPKQRQKEQVTPSKFRPCPRCNMIIIKKKLYRHTATCEKQKPNSKNAEGGCQAMQLTWHPLLAQKDTWHYKTHF